MMKRKHCKFFFRNIRPGSGAPESDQEKLSQETPEQIPTEFLICEHHKEKIIPQSTGNTGILKGSPAYMCTAFGKSGVKSRTTFSRNS